MRVGYYKDELIDIEADSVAEAASLYADEHHQIDEASDMDFELFVESDGKLFCVKMYTEYDPRYEVDSEVVIAEPPK